MTIRTKTPVCLDLLGGATYDPAYAEFNDSITLCAAIDIYTHASIDSSKTFIFEAKDKNFEISFKKISDIKDLMKNDRRLLYYPYVRLHIATLLYLVDEFEFDLKTFHLKTKNNLAFNSGLGGSSSLIISILKAFLEFFNIKYNKDFLAIHSSRIKLFMLKDYCSLSNNYGCSYENFSVIKKIDGEYFSTPYILNDNNEMLNDLRESLVLVFNKNEGHEFIKDIGSGNDIDISLISDIYHESENSIVKSKRNMDVSYLINSLKNYWILKNKIYGSYSKIQTEEFQRLLEYGFTGGKICGFYSNYYLMTCNPSDKDMIKSVLPNNFEVINFNFLT
jgi:D-glycero-alpha-D-manno-heptose-7-phosphate kinase